MYCFLPRDLNFYPEDVDNMLPETSMKFEMKIVVTKLLPV